MVYFITCKKNNDASRVKKLIFMDIVRLHGVPKIITLDRDPNFLSTFWRTLWNNMGTKLQFSSAYHPKIDG